MIVVEGFPESYKVPGFYGETQFGRGRSSYGGATLKVLVVGLKHPSRGSIAVDSEVKEFFSEDECDALGGAGGEAARMGRKALKTKGARYFMACPTAAVGAAAATATITITGTWSVAGTLRFWIGGDLVEVNIPVTATTVTAVALLIVAAVNANQQLPVTASNSSGVVTLTHNNPGVRGTALFLRQDQSLRPSGMTSTIAGGTAIQTNVMVPFTGGTGVESLTALLATLAPQKFDRIAWAHNDATSMADIEALCDDKAGPLVGLLEHNVIAHTGAISPATSIAQTTLNDQRFEMKWAQAAETPAGEIAASWASWRAMKESTNPNRNFDGDIVPGCKGQPIASTRPIASVQQAALDNGVSVCTTNEAGELVTIRAITTRSLNGSEPDYKTLDVGDAVTADYWRDRMKFIWATEFRVENEHLQDDPAEGEDLPPAGVGYPRLWNGRVVEELVRMQKEKILAKVKQLPPESKWNDNAKRIMTSSDILPLAKNHQLGFISRQLNAA